MTTTRDEYGADLATALHAYEEQLDRTLAAGGELISLMTLGRIQHRIAAVAGQEGLERVLASQLLMGQARDKVVGAHESLAKDARRLRIDFSAHAGGPIDKPDTDRPRPGTLRAVA